MNKRVVLLILISMTLTGCTSIFGIKDRTNDGKLTTSQATESLESQQADETVISNEYLLETETKKSLGNISINEESGNTPDNYGQLVAPTKPTESTTESEEITTEEVVWVTDATQIDYREETTQSQTQTETKDWGETPTMYSSKFGNPKYKTDIVLVDMPGIEKDSYGNYIIPYEMFSYNRNLPLNERGKIPYIFWYDELGNILNPFPDSLNSYKDKFELGTYEDDSKLKHLLPTTPVN